MTKAKSDCVNVPLEIAGNLLSYNIRIGNETSIIYSNDFRFRFIGELFKQCILKTSTMEYCMAILASQRSENSLECLCSLLKTTGKESEKVRLYSFL